MHFGTEVTNNDKVNQTTVFKLILGEVIPVISLIKSCKALVEYAERHKILITVISAG